MSPTVYESATTAGHTPTCATSQHMTMTSVCICGHDLTLTAPSPMMRALDVATRLVAQAQAEGIEVLTISTYAVGSDYMTVGLMTVDNDLTAALAFVLDLPNHRVHERPEPDGRYIEAFMGVVDGVEVTAQGLVPVAALPDLMPLDAIAGWVCPCGSRGWLLAGHDDIERDAYDSDRAVHDETCEVAR